MEEYRALFPITENVAYLDHAAAGPVSLPVIQAVNDFLVDRARRGSEAAPDSKALTERTRAKAAQFIGAAPEEIAFMKNTPDGINAVANGIDWQPGDNVVTVDIEFPANVYAWLNLRDRGVQTHFVSSHNGCIDTEELLSAINERTRVVALSWVEFHGGFRNDLKTIGAECRRRGVYLSVDAIQGMGVLAGDVRDLNVDFWCAASQKWLLAPHGIAPFYIRREILDEIRATSIGLPGINQGPSYLEYRLDLKPNAMRFEPGYVNQVGIAGLEAALDLFNQVGIHNIESHVMSLTGRLLEGLDGCGYLVYGPRADHQRSGVVSFRHPQRPASELRGILRSGGVVVSEREGHIRTAPHFYNTEAEIDRLLELLPPA